MEFIEGILINFMLHKLLTSLALFWYLICSENEFSTLDVKIL